MSGANIYSLAPTNHRTIVALLSRFEIGVVGNELIDNEICAFLIQISYISLSNFHSNSSYFSAWAKCLRVWLFVHVRVCLRIRKAKLIMRTLVVVDLEFSSTHLFTAVNEKNSKWKCFIAIDIATLLYGSGGSGLFWSLPKFPDLSGALVIHRLSWTAIALWFRDWPPRTRCNW